MFLASLCLAALPVLFQDPRTAPTLPEGRTLAWIHIPDVQGLRGALPRLPLLCVTDQPGWNTILEGVLGQQLLRERSDTWDQIFLPFDRGMDFVLLKSEGATYGFENLILGQASKASLLRQQRSHLESLFQAGSEPRQELVYKSGVAQDTPARYGWYQHRRPVELARGIPALALGRSDLCILQAGRRTVLRVAASYGKEVIPDPPLADMAGLIGLAGRKGRSRLGQELGESRKGLLLSTGFELAPLLQALVGDAYPAATVPVKRILTTLQEDQGSLVERILFVEGEKRGEPPLRFRSPSKGLRALVDVASEDCVAAVRIGLDLFEFTDGLPGLLNDEVLAALIPGLTRGSQVDVELCLQGSIKGTTSPQPMILISGSSGKLDAKKALHILSRLIRGAMAPKQEVIEPRSYVRQSGIYYIKFVDYGEEYTDSLILRIALGGGYLSLGMLGDRVAITTNPKTLRMAQKKLASGKTLGSRVPTLRNLPWTDGTLGQGFIDYRALSTRFGALTEMLTESLLPWIALLPQAGNVTVQISGLKTGLLPSLTQDFPLQTFEILDHRKGLEIVSRGGGLFSLSQWALACEGLFCLARIHALSRF